jgi:hypothetical protein
MLKNCKVVDMLMTDHLMKTRGGLEEYIYINLDTRWTSVVSFTPWPLYPRLFLWG